ncbi:MAG TPA: YbaK/EbsC family protein [Syntrophomonadaceae bacterium]|nr:YbaK/EbsC family protein [Syntrophomonadaceae bacterium]HOQ08962.1 YbaK/EbsC family protein [Syntrophomonadaceae bacterium]HPU47885.1 YbaK/EbsC family protein [Syntrophomonadaceae bacterium]
MRTIDRVQAYLNERMPHLKVIEFEQDTSTSALAAAALGTEVGQIAKTMLFKAKTGEFFLVVAAGDVRMDTKALRDLVGSKVRMANADEVMEITGFPVGGVCPFDLKMDVPIYLDESLKRYPVVYAAAGTPNSALPITYDELMTITQGKPCNVSILPE